MQGLKAPPIFAADDKFKLYCFFKNNKSSMTFHENRLPADDSHSKIVPDFFLELVKILQNMSSAAVVIGTLMVK